MQLFAISPRFFPLPFVIDCKLSQQRQLIFMQRVFAAHGVPFPHFNISLLHPGPTTPRVPGWRYSWCPPTAALGSPRGSWGSPTGTWGPPAARRGTPVRSAGTTTGWRCPPLFCLRSDGISQKVGYAQEWWWSSSGFWFLTQWEPANKTRLRFLVFYSCIFFPNAKMFYVQMLYVRQTLPHSVKQIF